MGKKIITSDDLANMDQKKIFESIIELWGMEGATEVVTNYFSQKEQSVIDHTLQDEQELYETIEDAIDAFAEIVIRKLKS